MAPQDANDAEEVTTVHVRRARDGDRDAASRLVERLTPVLLAQAAWRLGPRLRRIKDPEDLVAEAWLTLLPRLATLPPRDGRYTPVLLRFLGTTILHRVNALARHQLRRDTATAGAEPEATGPTPSIEITGVVTAAMRRERHDALHDALLALPTQDREIVFLRGIEQQENRVVAELLGITPEAAAMRYHRALRRLRERLPGSVFEELDAPGL